MLEDLLVDGIQDKFLFLQRMKTSVSRIFKSFNQILAIVRPPTIPADPTVAPLSIHFSTAVDKSYWSPKSMNLRQRPLTYLKWGAQTAPIGEKDSSNSATTQVTNPFYRTSATNFQVFGLTYVLTDESIAFMVKILEVQPPVWVLSPHNGYAFFSTD